MACIKSAPRSALVAFAPEAPYMAAGTLAGAVDVSFSSSANLEIFHLDFVSEGHDLPLKGSCPSSERFNRLSWGKVGSLSEEYSLGIVAGGLGDGSISVWNPKKLISSRDADSAFVASLEHHTGPVHGLEFSVLSPNLLASGAVEGEICIWNMENPSEPNRFPPLKNPTYGSQAEISYISWNPKFQHVLASTSHDGMTAVWDLRKQKHIISFSDSIKSRCSVLQWNPDISTQLIVASDDDSSPSLKLWDVRKTISPVKEFVGHTKGVIAMSWCPTDSSLLLTCARDSRTICWDTVTGEIICELPANTNWNFDVHWYPRIPGVISASSVDGKIGIYNIEACEKSGFGGELGVSARWRAPKWLKRPVGVSFGFGGKFVSFQPSPSTSSAQTCSSEVHVHNLVTEHNLVSRSSELGAAIGGGERSSLRVFCERKSQESKSEDDREAWGFLKVMFEDEGSARTKLLSHLGFSSPNAGHSSVPDGLGTNFGSAPNLGQKVTPIEQTVGQAGEFSVDNGEEFFNGLQPAFGSPLANDNVPNHEETLIEKEILNEVSDSTLDESIQHALIAGDYKGAVSLCVSANRMADAFVIAHVSGTELWKNTQNQYLKRSHLPYLKVVSALVDNDLMALVNTRPLSSWKDTLAVLCTFAQKEEWTMLCDTLASRLLAAGNIIAATLCYICAGNIDRTVELWSRNLKYEKGRSHVDGLQDVMEKTIVLAFATGQKQFSPYASKLIENYAELLASQGQLTTAMEYLKLLGSVDSSHELATLQSRILQSTQETDTSSIYIESRTAGVEPSFSSADQLNADHGACSLQHFQQGLPARSHSSGYQQQKLQGASGGLYSPGNAEPVVPKQQGVPGSSYHSSYRQPSGSYKSYQPATQKRQFQGFMGPTAFPVPSSTQMFYRSQDTHTTQMQSIAAPMIQQSAGGFVPTTPPTLKNVEQYQQPSFGPQLYSRSVPSAFQPRTPGQHSVGAGLSQTATVPSMKFPHSVAPTAMPGIPQAPHPGFIPGSGMTTLQPSTPADPVAQPVNVPPAPPPTVHTVDTSKVTAELRPVVATLTRLYNETSEALGGSRANPAKKREIDDNSKKTGSLLAKLSNQDISPNAANKLIQLCGAVDSGDYAAALHIQILLTTSDWDECNFWLAALKRMIKTRQNLRPR